MNPKFFFQSELAKKLPPEVKKLFEIFGDEILLVGGCVRDLLLKKEVNDFDFATRFPPEKIQKILEKNKIKAIPTGIKFGTITAVVNGKNFEITTLRKESETDGRHCQVEFVDGYAIDAARRDFTINALYMNYGGEIFDYFDGISDLKKQKIRFIGDAHERIKEDYLRILRFFRFSIKYAKSLDREGLKACVENKLGLKKLSRERIRSEFFKIISAENFASSISALQVLKSKKIAQEIFSQDLDIKALERLFELEKKLNFSANTNLKIATVFLNEKTDLKQFFHEICATNLEKKYFSFFYDSKPDSKQFPIDFDIWREGSILTPIQIKQLLAFVEKNLVLDFYIFSLVKNPELEKLSKAKKNLKFLKNFSLPKFPINGQDLLNIGLKDKNFGEMLKKAKIFWAKSNFKADKLEVLGFVAKKDS